MTAQRRGKRNTIALCVLASGYFAIYWGRAFSRRAGLALRESTQTKDRAEAKRYMEQRTIEVCGALGDEKSVERVRAQVAPIPLHALATEYLRNWSAGKLGALPKLETKKSGIGMLFGIGGLVRYAEAAKEDLSTQLTSVLVLHWLAAERVRGRGAANSTLGMKLIAARKLAKYGAETGHITANALASIEKIRAPKSMRGLAQREGAPSPEEVERAIGAMRCSRNQFPFEKLAELQFRTGLRRGEVVAIESSWILAESIRVPCDSTFEAKDKEPRTIFVDANTIALAHEIVELKKSHRLTIVGYSSAWKRACRKLREQGTPWPFHAKSHSMRAAYITHSTRSVPAVIVQKNVGHASIRTTEKYIGSTSEVRPNAFENVPLISAEQPSASGANVIPFRRRVAGDKK